MVFSFPRGCLRYADMFLKSWGVDGDGGGALFFYLLSVGPELVNSSLLWYKILEVLPSLRTSLVVKLKSVSPCLFRPGCC